MNPFELVKIGAGALIVAGAYFFGLHNGQNSEQLKIAQAQISELTATVKNYETQYKNQAIALAEMRAAESNARAGAPASPVLKKEPRALPIETQFDVLSWEQSVDDYCKRFEDLLNTVEKRYSSK